MINKYIGVYGLTSGEDADNSCAEDVRDFGGL